MDRLGYVARGNTHRLEPALEKKYPNVYQSGFGALLESAEACDGVYRSSRVAGRLELIFEGNKLVGANVLDISS